MKRKLGREIFSIAITVVLISILLAPFYQSSIIRDKITGNPPGWTDDVRLTNSISPDANPSISTFQDDVHIVWRDIWGGDGRIFYMNSTDGGQIWNNRRQLNVGGDGDHPDIATNTTNLHVVYDDNVGVSNTEIAYCNSTDGGISWSSSKYISVDDGFNSEGAKMAINNSNIHVIWVDARFGFLQSEVYYKRSTDGGITWDDGLGGNTDRRITHDLSGASYIGMDINGSNIHVLFCDGRNGNFDVYYTRSVDNGVTWDDGLGTPDQERILTSNATDHAWSSIAVNGSTIHVVWVDEVWPGPVFSIYYRNSTDNGASWGSIQQLVNPFPGTAYAPQLAVQNDVVHMTWHDMRDGGSPEIYYKNSTDNGATWNADLRLTELDGFISGGPKIAISGSQRHITWEDQRDGNKEIYYKRSPDFPPDTTPPDHSNETPPPDSYRDAPGTNISVHVTDPSGVNDTTIQLYVNGSLVSHNLNPITDGYNVSYESPGFEPGAVECRIVADDNLSNHLDYYWNFTVLAIYEIQLHEGWNLISVPHVQVDRAINEVLKDIDGKWDYIQWYDASDGNDHWKTNATFKPQQLNDLFYLNRSMAFWINITESNVNLTVRGLLPGSTTIQLYRGWNLVGYPSLDTETVGNALWGTGADSVEVFNATELYRIKEVGPTYIMKPGEGYWVRVPSDTTWVVDW